MELRWGQVRGNGLGRSLRPGPVSDPEGLPSRGHSPGSERPARPRRCASRRHRRPRGLAPGTSRDPPGERLPPRCLRAARHRRRRGGNGRSGRHRCADLRARTLVRAGGTTVGEFVNRLKRIVNGKVPAFTGRASTGRCFERLLLAAVRRRCRPRPAVWNWTSTGGGRRLPRGRFGPTFRPRAMDRIGPVLRDDWLSAGVTTRRSRELCLGHAGVRSVGRSRWPAAALQGAANRLPDASAEALEELQDQPAGRTFMGARRGAWLVDEATSRGRSGSRTPTES